MLHDGTEEIRRGRQVVKIVAVAGVVFVDLLQKFFQLLVGAVVAEFAGQVVDVTLEPFLQVGINGFAGEFFQVLRQLAAKFVGGHGIARHADHGKLSRQEVVFRQVIERGDQLAAGQIAGSAENDHGARIATSSDTLAFCCYGWLGHVFIFPRPRSLLGAREK